MFRKKHLMPHAISRIQNDDRDQRHTPPSSPNNRSRSDEMPSQESQQHAAFIHIMDIQFQIDPLLRNSTTWKRFSRYVVQMTCAGHLHQHKVINKLKPGSKEYARNQILYTRTTYAGLLQYMKKYLQNIISKDRGDVYTAMGKEKREVPLSVFSRMSDFSAKTEPQSQDGDQFIGVYVHRNRQLIALVRQFFKNTILMLTYWHKDNYGEEYALLENLFVDFLTYWIYFLSVKDQVELFRFAELMSKNFTKISEDFRNGDNSILRDAFTKVWWLLESAEGDIDQFTNISEIRKSAFTERQGYRFKVGRQREPKTTKKQEEISGETTLDTSFHSTQSDVLRDCIPQFPPSSCGKEDLVVIFNFQAERICKVLLRILARTRIHWDKQRMIDNVILAHSIGKLLDRSSSTAAYMLDLSESDLLGVGRLILSAEKFLCTKFSKNHVFGLFRHALSCVRVLDETQNINLHAENMGQHEHNLDIKEENKENDEPGYRLRESTRRGMHPAHEKLVTAKYAESKPYFNDTIKLVFDVIKLARERHSPALPSIIFQILEQFKKELLQQEKVCAHDISTWFRILTEIISSKFDNSKLLITTAVSGLLFGLSTKSLDPNTFLTFQNACFEFIRDDSLMLSFFDKFMSQLMYLAPDITPDPTKAKLLSNSLVNLYVPAKFTNLHFTACANLLNYLLMKRNENSIDDRLAESIFLIFTQLRGHEAIFDCKNLSVVILAAKESLAKNEKLPDDVFLLTRKIRTLLYEKSPFFALGIQKLANFLLHRKDPIKLPDTILEALRKLLLDTYNYPGTRHLTFLFAEAILCDFCHSNEIIQIGLPYRLKDGIEGTIFIPCKALPKHSSDKEVGIISSLFETVLNFPVASREVVPYREPKKWTKADFLHFERLLGKIYEFMSQFDLSKAENTRLKLSKTILQLLFIPFKNKRSLSDPRIWRLIYHFHLKDVDEYLRSVESNFLDSFVSFDPSLWNEVVSIACYVDELQSDRKYAKKVLLKLLPIAGEELYKNILESVNSTDDKPFEIEIASKQCFRQTTAVAGCQKILEFFPSLIKTAESRILDVMSKTLVEKAVQDVKRRILWERKKGTEADWIPFMGTSVARYASTLVSILGLSQPSDLFVPLTSMFYNVDENPSCIHPNAMLMGSGALFNLPRDMLYNEVDDLFAPVRKRHRNLISEVGKVESTRRISKKLGPALARATTYPVIGPQLCAKLLTIYQGNKHNEEKREGIENILRLVYQPVYNERHPIEHKRRFKYDVTFADLTHLIKFTYAHLCHYSHLSYRQMQEVLKFFMMAVKGQGNDYGDSGRSVTTVDALNHRYSIGKATVFLNEPYGDAYCRLVLESDWEARYDLKEHFVDVFMDLRAHLSEPEPGTEEPMMVEHMIEPSQNQGRRVNQRYPPFLLKEVARSVFRVLHQPLSEEAQTQISCFYLAADKFDTNPREENFHWILFPASHYIFLMQLCVPVIKAHFFYETIRVIDILFKRKFSQSFGIKLWSSVHNDLFVSEKLRQEVVIYCVELLGYFCRLWRMADVDERRLMLGYFRKYVRTIVELLKRKRPDSDIVFLLKYLPKSVWGRIKYRWHHMEIVDYPCYIDEETYVDNLGDLLTNTEYYYQQLPAIQEQQIPSEVQGHALSKLHEILASFSYFEWKVESVSSEILIQFVLPKFYQASRYLSFSNDLEVTSIQLASYFTKKVKPRKRVPTERHHVNIHEIKFEIKKGSRIRPVQCKGKVLLVAFLV